eukprot:5457279-Amphidinium_carterae.1
MQISTSLASYTVPNHVRFARVRTERDKVDVRIDVRGAQNPQILVSDRFEEATVSAFVSEGDCACVQLYSLLLAAGPCVFLAYLAWEVTLVAPSSFLRNCFVETQSTCHRNTITPN